MVINQKVVYGFLAAITIMFFMSTCNSCSNKRAALKTAQELDSLQTEVEKRPTLEEYNRTLQIEGYKISKRMLYDNNAIVRTAMRPDDRMNEYDVEIEKLEKQN